VGGLGVINSNSVRILDTVRATPRVPQKYNPQNSVLGALLNNYFLKTSFLHGSSPIFCTQKYFEIATSSISWMRTSLQTDLVGF
jgi:hypothetical protein